MTPRRAGHGLLRGLVWGLLVVLGACSGPPSEETPSGALRLFFESVQRAQEATGEDRVEALEQAYDLLDEGSRRRLAERSRATGALGAREHQPYEMIAAYPSRGAAVPTRSANFREVIAAGGDRATVTVRLPDEHSVEVEMVREEGAWRVVLGVPEVIAE